MATVKVTALTETTSPQATDVLLISQSGVSKKVQITNLPVGTPADDSITYAKIQNVSATDRILGRDSAGAGDVEEITVANVLTMLNVEAGADVTDATNVDAAGAVMESDYTTAHSLLVQQSGSESPEVLSVGTNTIVGRVTGGGSAIDDLSSTQVRSLLNVEDGADVTDATNVTAAGALMDSEVTNLAEVKAFAASDYATAAQGTLATNALPKAGGAMTGAITTNSTFDGVDIATRDAVLTSTTTTANAALPKAGGTLTGTVTVSANAVGTVTTDNDGSFAMSATNNFKCTPTGDFTLTFTSIVAQSGNILLVNSGGHTVSAHANTKVDANLLATVSTAGTYLLSYFSDGTNVYMTNSAIYT
jgi:hypothetical protein